MEMARFRSHVLRSTTALLSATSLLFSFSAHSFDPDDGVTQSDPQKSTKTALPDTSILTGAKPLGQTIRPLYTPQKATQLNRIAPSSGEPGYLPPITTIKMPSKPLYPDRTSAAAPLEPVVTEEPTPPVAITVPTPPTPPVPPIVTVPSMAEQLPPVSPAVAARADAVMAEQKTATESKPVIVEPIPMPSYVPAPEIPIPTVAIAPTPTGFIAPAPLIAQPAPQPIKQAVPPPAPAVVETPASPVAAPAIVPASPTAPIEKPQIAAAKTPETPPASKLSEQTRAILSTIPSKVDTQKPRKGGEITLDRVTPQIEAILGSGEREEKFEAVGLSIKVRRPGLDANYELNRAYTSLMGGETEQAIIIYKDILSTEPKNQDALFGLAATYHRLGNIDKARPLYGMLLKLNPNHREGLNNFLVLVADESPEDALPELERLEDRNPDFSPIPAQIAIVMDKLGYADKAHEKMLRAIELAPDNLTYKYNLAVMLDRQHRYADAGALYKLLIAAGLRGEKVPASTESMQKRLNFISSASVPARSPGG